SAFRTMNGTYRAAQSIGMTLFGLPRDIVGIPDAFMGSPHPLGIPKVGDARPILKELVADKPTRQLAEPWFKAVVDEKIERPAVKVNDEVFEGKYTHSEAFDKAFEKLGDEGIAKFADKIEEGWLTSAGRFVDRKEATRITGMGDAGGEFHAVPHFEDYQAKTGAGEDATAARVRDDVFGQLKATGMSDEEASANAAVMAARYATR